MKIKALISKKYADYKLRRYIRKCLKKYGIPAEIYVDMPTPISKADSSLQQKIHCPVREH